MRIDEITQDLTTTSESEQLAAVQRDGFAITYIKNLSINVLNACKREIITAILTAIRAGDINYASHLLQKIQNTNWPEVAIVKKSLAAIENK
jgi:hypothetical protein